jgi:outer membrane protein OmpA-like peptidoglycan-associated protein
VFRFSSGQEQLARPDDLRRAAEYIRNHPEIGVVRVVGHTDGRGDPDANLRLSERRAQHVVDGLVALQVSADRLEAVGRGAEDPVAPNDTREGRAKNRRVVLEVASAK